MDTAGSEASEILHESSKKERKRNRKRKRHSSELEHIPGKNNKVSNATLKEPNKDTMSREGTPQSGKHGSEQPQASQSQEERRPNPFTIPSTNTQDTPTNSPKPASRASPSTPLSEQSRSKRVVKFNGGDSSDDSDFSPKDKRRISAKHSVGRHSQSPKAVHVSTKKISNKDNLNRRKRELEEERKKLPIWSAREPLLKMIEENQVTILLGETGCGKSTQLPQFLLSKYQAKGIIGITQPRRVAAINLARRVAEEHGTSLRNRVGYTIRFDDATTSETKIKYLTDGMLLRELQFSPNLAAYSVIILDEAHERSLRTDLLMGFIKLLLPSRPDLRVIVMSATLDAERFNDFFAVDGKRAQIGFVQGREYPVEVFHTTDLATGFDGSGSGDYVDGVLKCILQIHWSKERGDILVFLTGTIYRAPSNCRTK